MGTVLHPAALGGQILGRSVLGIAHAIGQKWVYDPHYGLPVAKRFYQNRPPTILDVPVDMQWEALDIPDPRLRSARAASASHPSAVVAQQSSTRFPTRSATRSSAVRLSMPTPS